ncbi:MAG: TldD/PmbA family protein [Bryobacteraceae bacterium]
MRAPALEELTARAVRLALDAGATEAECTASEGAEFSATVRMREVESVKEAGSRGLGVRILKGRRTGSAFTSDLSAEGIRNMVRAAVENASITTDDPNAGLPEPEELGSLQGGLDLYHDDVPALEAPFKIAQATEAEGAALAHDPRIANSEGGVYETHVTSRAFSNSRGFTGSYSATRCWLSASPVASDGGSMERDYWFTMARTSRALESPADVGKKAAERALRRLNAKKIATQTAPVIFEPRTARTLLGHIFEAVEGDAVYRNASFLAGRIGEKIASGNVTVIDDGTLPGLFGTSPFDDEGVPSRRTVVVERGVLKSYLLNSYTARKLGLKTTGNASRGLSGNAGVGHGNLFLEAGDLPPADILRRYGKALFVTELLGFGVNIVTGDYSRGAAGLWIENGEAAQAVSEVTIAGNLKQMLMDMEFIGADLEFLGSVAAPTVAIHEMTISGNG